MLNCDVLTTLNFRQFMNDHCAGNSLLTIASQKKSIPIDLGVLEVESDRVTNFLEKPTRSARVSMGIYMMNPEVIEYIPANQYYDIPDLIRSILANGEEVRHFANDDFWIDIGRPTEYLQANEDFPLLKERILPNG